MRKSKLIFRSLLMVLVILLLALPSFASGRNASKGSNELSELELYPGGMAFGVKVISKGLTVVKFTETEGENASGAYLAGMRQGDIITKVNGVDITSIEGFVTEIEKCKGAPIIIEAIRGNEELSFRVKAKYCKEDGKYKTGIWVKDSTSGIGTVTFVNPKNNAFGGLGHAICDSSNGRVVPISKGLVLDVDINGVVKGRIGDAGELKGVFKNKKIGSLIKNCTSGVFGITGENVFECPEGPMSLCPKEELKEGDAYIWCTVTDGKPEKYSIKISNIDTSNTSVKNFKVTVTDPRLLNITGGIVQGMSGSPIIQNERIVGAVTHVLINNPTEGYGIFIENMINAMPEILR